MIQNGQIIGVITARELERVSDAKIAGGMRVLQVMRQSVARAYPDESLYTAWVRMSRNNLRQMVVTDRENAAQFAGILSAETIAGLLRAPSAHHDSGQPTAGSDEISSGDGEPITKTMPATYTPDILLHQLNRTEADPDPFDRQRVAEAMGAAPEMISATMPLAQMRVFLSDHSVALVADPNGRLWGILTPADIRSHHDIADGQQRTAGDIAVRCCGHCAAGRISAFRSAPYGEDGATPATRHRRHNS